MEIHVTSHVHEATARRMPPITGFWDITFPLFYLLSCCLAFFNSKDFMTRVTGCLSGLTLVIGCRPHHFTIKTATRGMRTVIFELGLSAKAESSIGACLYGLLVGGLHAFVE